MKIYARSAGIIKIKFFRPEMEKKLINRRKKELTQEEDNLLIKCVTEDLDQNALIQWQKNRQRISKSELYCL